MNNLSATSVFLVLSTFFALAQTSEYKIRVKGREVIISHKNKTHGLNLSDKIDAAKVTETEILFVNRRDAFLYLVIDVSGQSKVKSDNRQCGAGTESNFIWVKLDSHWKILDSKSVRYESCWSSVSNDNYRKTSETMYIEIDDFREDVKIKLTYKADEPEKGFQVIQTPLEEPK